MISALALAPLLAACSSEDDKPKVDPSASSYGTLRVGIGALREMRAVAYLYAQALRNVGYNVEVVTNEDSRSKFLDALKQTEANTPEPDTLDLVIDYSARPPVPAHPRRAPGSHYRLPPPTRLRMMRPPPKAQPQAPAEPLTRAH